MKKNRNLLAKIAVGLGLLGGVFTINTFFVNQISGGVVQSVHAQTPTTNGPSGQGNTPTEQAAQAAGSESNGMEQLAKTLEKIVQMIYVLLWPLLWIAGKSLENDLVYGGIFHLDKYLWMFWNIMKNFANYIMGFVFIISILMYFFNAKGGGKLASISDPKKVIKNLLIGSVLIQASWFLVGALIDVSTILVYAIGQMPLSILKNESGTNTLGTVRVMMPNVNINLDSKTSNNGSSGQGTTPATATSSSSADASKKQNISITYQCNGQNLTHCIYNDKGQMDREKMGGASQCIDIVTKKVLNVGENGSTQATDINCGIPLSEITQKAGMTGPLFTLYASLLDMSGFGITSSNKTIGVLSFEFIIKTVIAIALFLPLLTLAIVLIMRVVVLWMVIGFSPIIFLSEVFHFGVSKKFSMKNILGLVFLPVTAVFAISLSIIFLSLLTKTDPKNGQGGQGSQGEQYRTENLLKSFNMEKGSKAGCVKMKLSDTGGTQQQPGTSTELCFGQPKASMGELDLIPRMLINFLGIALMWSIVFTAMKTNEFTNGVVNSFEKFGENVVKSTPIIPGVPGASIAGLSHIPTALGTTATQMKRDEEGKMLSKIDELFKGNSQGGGSPSSSSGGGDYTPPSSPVSGNDTAAIVTALNNISPGPTSGLNPAQSQQTQIDFMNDLLGNDSRMATVMASTNAETLQKVANDLGIRDADKKIREWIERNNGYTKVIANKIYHDSTNKKIYYIENNKIHTIKSGNATPLDTNDTNNLRKLINDNKNELKSKGINPNQLGIASLKVGDVNNKGFTLDNNWNISDIK